MTVAWLDWLALGEWPARVALTLVHFLWQGVVIGVVAATIARTLRTASATSRYSLYAAALAGLAVCVVATFAVVDVPAGWRVERDRVGETVTSRSNSDRGMERQVTDTPSESVLHEGKADASPSSTSSTTIQASPPIGDFQQGGTAADRIAVQNEEMPQLVLVKSVPVIVATYLAGVSVFLLRLLIAVWGGHRLRENSKVVSDSALLEIVRDQTSRLGLRLSPAVAFCERVAVPTVVGVVRPMVLLPASLVTGLDPVQFAAIISHELAHIRRFDLLVNLIQRLIESLLFFHPAVWYISRRLSTEREACCDDLVVASGYEPMTYAGALLRMAELCANTRFPDSVALAAAGRDKSQLECRIRRLMEMTHHSQLRLTRAGILLIALVVVPVVVMPTVIRRVANAQEAETIDCALAFQIAVQSSKPNPGEDINGGHWNVVVDWVLPIQSDGGPGRIVSTIDGATVRLQWDTVRLMRDGITFNGLEWAIDNQIVRRDGVNHRIGGRRIAPPETFFDGEFEWLASVSLDTMRRRKSDRHLAIRARYLARPPQPKPLNIAQLTGLADDEARPPSDAVLQEMHDLLAETTKLKIDGRYHKHFVRGGRQFSGTDTSAYKKAVRELVRIQSRFTEIANRLQEIHSKELGQFERVAEDAVLECSEEPMYGRPSNGVILYAKSTETIRAGQLLLFHAGGVYRTRGTFRPLRTTGQGFFFRPNANVPAGQRFVVACIQDAPEEIANVNNGFMPNSDRARDPGWPYRTQVFAPNGKPMSELAEEAAGNHVNDDAATATQISRRKIEAAAAEAPDKLHAIGLPCHSRMGWKWIVYLPPDQEWNLYGAIRRIPFPILIKAAPEDTNYRIRASEQGRFVQLEGALSVNDDGRWQLIMEADRPIIGGMNAAAYLFYRPGSDVREAIARYVARQEPTSSYMKGSTDIGRVTRKQNDMLNLVSVRYVPKSFDGEKTAETLLPGYCVWIEAAKPRNSQSQPANEPTDARVDSPGARG